MAREVQGGVVAINTLVTANGSKDYPIVLADDVQLDDGTTVEEKFKQLESGGGGEIGFSEIDDTLISSTTTWSSQNLSEKFSEIRDTHPSFQEVYLKGETYNKQETQDAIDLSISSKLESYYSSTVVDAKIEQSATLTLTEAKEYTDQSNLDIKNEIDALKNIVGAGITRVGADFIISLFQ